MQTYIVDTNTFLRFLLNDIPGQKKEAEKLFGQAKNGQIKVNVLQITIFELEFILRKYYNFPKLQVLEKLEAILGSDYLEVESQKEFISALNWYSKYQLSFVDCFLTSCARERDQKLFTFDQDLQKVFANG